MKNFIKKTLTAASAAVMAAAAVPFAAPVHAADTVFPFVIEGEKMEGADLWTSIYQTEIPGYSGDGFWYLTASPASFEVTVPEDAMYQLTVHGAQILNEGARQQAVKVNGVKYLTQAAYSEKWTDYDFGMIRLNKGVNTIEFISEYGYYGSTSIEPNADVKAAVSYIFDENGPAVQHRVLCFYIGSSAWHETQNFVVELDGVRFFDMYV